MRSWFRRRQAVPGQRRPYRPCLEGLEERCLLSVTIDPISTQTVPAGKSLVVPITATDTANSPVTYSITSSDNNISIQSHPTTNTFLQLQVSQGGNSLGTMTFELFNDLTPNTVATITGLVNKNFYNGLTFHRVIPNFVIQGGDPLGNGTGGPGFQFNDEYNQNLIYSGNGQLAMANAGPDTNGSQFFITIGTQRALDFNNPIFGQLLRGFNVVQAIAAVPRDANDKPLTPVVITSAKVIQDTSDQAITLLSASGFTGSATITVTATDATGAMDVKTFTVQSVTDTINDPPFLSGTVPTPVTTAGTPVTFALNAIDLENDPLTFQAIAVPGQAAPPATFSVNGNQVTVTPKAGFTGTFNMLVGVKDTGATMRGSTANPFDTHMVTVTVTPQLSPDQTFVNKIYLDLLGRAPDGQTFSFLVPMLDKGQVNRFQVAQVILNSPEFHTRQVQNTYGSYLHRAADGDGLANSVNFLNTGGTFDELRILLTSSPEYFQQRGGGTNRGFVNALLSDATGGVDSKQADNDTTALDHGLSRAMLASMVFQTVPASQNDVQSMYQSLLDRAADGDSLNNLTNLFQQHFPETTALVLLLGSTEYFNRN